MKMVKRAAYYFGLLVVQRLAAMRAGIGDLHELPEQRAPAARRAFSQGRVNMARVDEPVVLDVSSFHAPKVGVNGPLG